MYKKYNRGIIERVENNNLYLRVNNILLEFSLENVNEELVRLLSRSINHTVVVEIKAYWFITRSEAKIVQVYDEQSFDFFLFETFLDVYSYTFSRNNYNFSSLYLINRFLNQVNRSHNIFEWFLTEYNLVNTPFYNLIMFFYNNQLDFELINEFFYPSFTLDLDTFTDQILEKIYNYIKNITIYIDINNYYQSIYDFLLSARFRMNDIQIQALYFALKMYRQCSETESVCLDVLEWEILKYSKIDESHDNNYLIHVDQIIEYCLENNLINNELQHLFYPSIYFDYEQGLANKLLALHARNNNQFYFLEDYILNQQIETYSDLNPDQVRAINTFMNNKVCLVSGGAGTGKTRLIQTLVDIVKFNDKDAIIKICAPSGMAANNVKNSFDKDYTDLSIDTIHRMLKGRGLNNFKYNISNKLNCDVLIIDECSMIDLRMFYHLLIATDNNIKKIVMIGDVNQLPSINVGSVFEDLIHANIFPTVYLHENMRQSENYELINFANRIIDVNNGFTAEEINQIIDNNNMENITFWFNNEPTEVYDLIVNQYRNIDLRNVRQKACQVISNVNDINKDGLYATQVLNQNITNALLNNNNRTYGFLALERVIVKKNLYKHNSNLNFDLFNGDIGVVLNIENRDVARQNNETQSLQWARIRFDAGIIEVYVDEQRRTTLVNKGEAEIQLESAFAVSLHKLQGGEYNTIVYAVAGSGASGNFHSKRTAYTAITRGRQRVFICGNRETFVQQVTTDYQNPRTNLINLLIANNDD
ncbi:exodeoxyribonuclease V alpha subunit [Spiroplasma helicoides]|uniref:Exodeoxyribonuclease V alpha subunit n=1 Tax=Spiroplasma helicoides TaxID=216938 RepID=A0A1B3SKE1_9MOLU|nr:AAA family ATPase [Spiroplasma helicoides]AOG60397.1 exodeoxyribonuclease V alpha subunit [Spiroplasma helicoides]